VPATQACTQSRSNCIFALAAETSRKVPNESFAISCARMAGARLPCGDLFCLSRLCDHQLINKQFGSTAPLNSCGNFKRLHFASFLPVFGHPEEREQAARGLKRGSQMTTPGSLVVRLIGPFVEIDRC
jgi:hypothetical protein